MRNVVAVARRALRSLILGGLLILSTVPVAIAQRGHGGSEHVRGYYRKNGTYVAPYTRHAPGTAGEVRLSSPTTHYTVPRVDKPPKAPNATLGPVGERPAKITHEYKAALTPRASAAPRSSSGNPSGQRDANGRIHRSSSARHEFMRLTGYPHGRPGYVIDHIVPLACGGSDSPSNMQWQTIAAAKAKDRTERIGCGSRGGHR